MKHSPGPWIVENKRIVSIKDNLKTSILQAVDESDPSCAANLKLSAAAPEMKDLLGLLIIRLQGPMNVLYPVVIEAEKLLRRIESEQ